MMLSTKQWRPYLIVALLLASACGGCALDEVKDKGKMCPPTSDDRNLGIAYIQMGAASVCLEKDNCFSEAFRTKICPVEYGTCYYDSSQQYYCMTRCPSDQVACDGQCIDPKTNSQFCGATSECADVSVGCCTGFKKCSDGEVCVEGMCQEKSCRDGATKCVDGEVYACNGKWEKTKTCKDKLCNEDKTECYIPTDMPCSYKGKSVSHGTLLCNDSLKGIVKCDNGTLRDVETCKGETVCISTAASVVCDIPEFSPCKFNNIAVLHNQSLCDGNRVRTCFDGELDGGYSCTLDGKTLCRDGECVVPTCLFNDEEIADGASVCDGNVLKTCMESAFDEGMDCAGNADGKIYCRNNQCEAPKSCTLEGRSSVQSGSQLCSADNKIVKCDDGVLKVVEDCQAGQKACVESTSPHCIPVYHSIKEIRADFDKLLPEEKCKDLPKRDAWEHLRIDANVEITGVVTALRDNSGNNNKGFVMQQVGVDPKYSGIIIQCANKVERCQKYEDGSSVAVGDNVKVTASQLYGYYCQLQVAHEKDEIKVEKLNSKDAITPVVISARELDDPTVEFEANNPYNNVLVTIKTLTATEKSEKPNGMKAKDIDGSDAIVSPMIWTDKDPFDNKLTVDKTYDITGVGIWSEENSVLAIRNIQDLVEIPDCQSGKTEPICLKRKGVEWATQCNDGKRETASDVDCTKDGKICYTYVEVTETTPGEGEPKTDPVKTPKAACRQIAKCTGMENSVTAENTQGCKDANTLSTCAYNEACKDGDCEKGIWKDDVSCSKGCDLDLKKCKAPELQQCGFTAIDEKNLSASIRLQALSDAAVTASIYCTLDTNAAILAWANKIATAKSEKCDGCASGIVEYQAAKNSLPSADGAYSCVAVVNVDGGKSYVCPTSLGKPVDFKDSLKANDAWIRQYAVGNQPVVLASWNFESKTCALDAGCIKSGASFSLSLDGQIKCDQGYAYAMIQWGSAESPNFASDPYWKIEIDTTDYEKISIEFETRTSASGKGSKLAAAYKIGDGAFKAFGTDVTLSDTNKTYPKTALPAEAANQKSLVIGLFPYNSGGKSPNNRIDNLKVWGTKK